MQIFTFRGKEYKLDDDCNFFVFKNGDWFFLGNVELKGEK